MPQLATLNLSCCSLDEGGVAVLATAFPALASLKTLKLHSNPLEDAGAATLAVHMPLLTSGALETLEYVVYGAGSAAAGSWFVGFAQGDRVCW